ncbi:MAG: biopolymer transporter ExbD [Hydrogenovibrio sp.]|uniref:ExbD/TolR family protein n=1 Tax=Hydrogenovibrio sp. TaxID=2065821 RepID=UPI0028707C68|nr:biopolymer transporter ExbD [Hydrogenovibrio sp.]MDR9499997.1 biopolymer transporter ExbD [Hydrogenovibrio sp.]
MIRYRKRTQEDSNIDISPLIDMVFILLIFFMVSATFVKDMDLEINRPKASSSTPSSTKALRVYIDASGDTYLDEKPIRTWMIQSKLRDMLRTSSDSTVLVVTDESVPSRKLIEVVDQCRLSGAEDVGVVTETEGG